MSSFLVLLASPSLVFAFGFCSLVVLKDWASLPGNSFAFIPLLFCVGTLLPASHVFSFLVCCLVLDKRPGGGDGGDVGQHSSLFTVSSNLFSVPLALRPLSKSCADSCPSGAGDLWTFRKEGPLPSLRPLPLQAGAEAPASLPMLRPLVHFLSCFLVLIAPIGCCSLSPLPIHGITHCVLCCHFRDALGTNRDECTCPTFHVVRENLGQVPWRWSRKGSMSAELGCCKAQRLQGRGSLLTRDPRARWKVSREFWLAGRWTV